MRLTIMFKKIISYLSVIFLSITGGSAKSQVTSAEFEAKQQAELYERLIAEEDGERVFCGQCDDALSQPIIIAELESDDSDPE